MSGIFLDTGYLIALVNKKDNLHDILEVTILNEQCNARVFFHSNLLQIALCPFKLPANKRLTYQL